LNKLLRTIKNWALSKLSSKSHTVTSMATRNASLRRYFDFSRNHPHIPQYHSYKQKPTNHQDEDAQLSKAIEISMNEAKEKKISLDLMNPEQRVRKSGVPVGLKNIGNSKIFLIQPATSTPYCRLTSKTRPLCVLFSRTRSLIVIRA